MTVPQKILVGGCFDIVHYGHLLFLEKAKSLGKYLVVALESDEFIRRHKKREPIHTQSQRERILKALRVVDEVIPLSLMSSYEEYLDLVNKVRPSVIAVTKGDPQLRNKQRQAEVVGAKVIEVTSRVENLSSKAIIVKLSE